MPTPADEMTYEQARDELVSVVARLEAGGETLDGALALWERGEALAARCQEWLDGARRRLDAARTPAEPVSEPGAGLDVVPDAAPGAADRTPSRTTPGPTDPEDLR